VADLLAANRKILEEMQFQARRDRLGKQPQHERRVAAGQRM